MTHYTDHVTKVHMDDFISCHVVGCSKLAINQFATKLYPYVKHPKLCTYFEQEIYLFIYFFVPLYFFPT